MGFDFISVKEAAEIIGVTQRWIQQLCKEGKVEGAIRLGGTGPWLIPTHWKLLSSNEKIKTNNISYQER